MCDMYRYVCVLYRYAGTGMDVCIHACVCGSQRRVSGVSSITVHLIPLRQSLSLNLELDSVQLGW